MCATASAERPGETVKPPTRRAPRALSPSSQCSRGGSRALPSQRADARDAGEVTAEPRCAKTLAERETRRAKMPAAPEPRCAKAPADWWRQDCGCALCRRIGGRHDCAGLPGGA